MSKINYLLLLTGRKPFKGTVTCNETDVEELCSEVVNKHAAGQGIKVEPAQLTAYSVLDDDYDDYNADIRQFSPGALKPLQPTRKLIGEERIVLTGSSSQVGLVESSQLNLYLSIN